MEPYKKSKFMRANDIECHGNIKIPKEILVFRMNHPITFWGLDVKECLNFRDDVDDKI